MSVSRNQQNYIIMTIIYEALTDLSVHRESAFRDFDELVNDFSLNEILSEMETDVESIKVDKYIGTSVDLALRHYVDVINMVSPFLKNWTWERIPLLSQAIILMSVSHFYYVEKVDKRIVIDVAINLAKKYIEEKQAKFIHALLNEVLK